MACPVPFFAGIAFLLLFLLLLFLLEQFWIALKIQVTVWRTGLWMFKEIEDKDFYFELYTIITWKDFESAESLNLI